MHTLKLSRMDLYLSCERPLEEHEVIALRSYLERLGKGEPAAYIEESVAFFGIQLKVTPDVLIPRPETEILVEKVAKRLEGRSLKGKRLLDLCSGSGCIGLSLKARFPELDLLLIDLSPKALAVARENSERLGLSATFLEGDLLAPLKEEVDFIVSNPPYVSDEEFAALDPSVRQFEPEMALRGGKDGLDFYRRIAKESRKCAFFLEIGFRQGEAVKRIFEEAGYRGVVVEKDWAGHDRFLFVENE